MSDSNSPASAHKVEKSGSPEEIVPYGESEVVRRRDTTADVTENCATCSPQHPRWWIPGIRKDDEFFHFVVFCFAFGTALVCYYKYSNWIVSFGIGLMIFAALETTGIYFGLVYRIRHVLESLIPLLSTVKKPGFRKAQ
ncbi:transmembrane protein 40 [Tiliqua scincoides]|uniref:transmembrane protein 40 n=1 Tax=Tiliqua scincoides TaxID=71010 RepID=UPI0034627866